MVQKIVRNPMFLAQKCEPATKEDAQIAQDLLDTLRDNIDHCVGMCANMIGERKTIIAIAAGPFQFVMINPVITKKKGEYQTEEGCLSLDGVRPCTRYEEIEVDFLNQNFEPQHAKYTGLTAESIQHQIDHCNGIVI
ncbi:MAG: peptide deformylase [Pseudobutyrivibrio sp.]|nr:peptide deformylase [Pseudobutyrivibrio sp.]